MSSDLPVQVRAAPEFQRRLRNLAKKYRQIRADLQPVFEQLQVGNFVGDQILGTGFTVLKVRVKNRSLWDDPRSTDER